MNRRQIINKILHEHIDVNKYEDYTNYKKLITAIEEWHESEVKKLPIHNVSNLLCGSFDPDNKTSSATKCKCGREKWEHPKAT